ncbi:MAG TPA: hypothetical protein VNX61_07080, partial [Rhizomicrobium sp.]|nr:hypothetical protein [Rhizomicrobium sp.]
TRFAIRPSSEAFSLGGGATAAGRAGRLAGTGAAAARFPNTLSTAMKILTGQVGRQEWLYPAFRQVKL